MCRPVCNILELNAYDSVQARLVSLFAGQELGCGMEGVQRRMQDLVQVVPDLGEPQLSAAFCRPSCDTIQTPVPGDHHFTYSAPYPAANK